MEVSKICRTCLALDGIILSIYDSKGSSGNGCVADMLSDLTCIKPRQSDGMPEKICLACISEINRCYSFKMKCENSERTLRQLLEIPSEPEPEPVTIHKAIEEDCPSFKAEDNPPSELPKRKFDSSVIILKQEIKAAPTVDTSLVLSVNTDEELEASYFNVQSEENEEVEANEDKIQEEAIDDDNSGDYDSIVSKFVYESQDEEAQMVDEEIPEKKITPTKIDKGQKNELQCLLCPMAFVHPRNLAKHIDKYHDAAGTKHEHSQVSSVKTFIIDPEKGNTDEQDIFQELDPEEEYELQPIEETIVKQEPETLTIELPLKGELRCPRCKAIFARQAQLKTHIKHNKCSEPQYSCGDCQKVFNSLKSLNLHVRTHNVKFTCTTCGESLDSKEDLTRHNKHRHGASHKYECETCNKVFTMRSTLKDHKRIHTGEKPFVCDLCGKSFTQNANLRQHVMRHNNTKPYKCDICTRTFVSKGELYAHLRSHNGEHPFQCDVCPSAFTTSSSLAKHKRIHTGERPYPCDFCPMRFTALNTLKNHRRVHTGEKPYKCQYCDRGFAQKTDCSIHMRIHTGEKRYGCHICNSRFQQSGTLRNHMKTHERSSTQQTEKQEAEEEEVEQPSSSVVEVEVDNDEEMKDVQQSEGNQQQKVGNITEGAMEMGDGDLLHYAIEECSSGNSEFSSE